MGLLTAAQLKARSNQGKLINLFVSMQVGVTLRSEDVLRKVFSELALEIITTEEKNVSFVAWQPVTLVLFSHNLSRTFQQQEAIKSDSNNHTSLNSPKRYVEITWGRICAILGIIGGNSNSSFNFLYFRGVFLEES